MLVAVLAGCASGEARTVPTTIPPITAKDGRLGIYIGITTDGGVAGAELAIAEINRAGGVNGHPVRIVDRGRADVVIGGTTSTYQVDEVKPVALDDDFLDRLHQVEPTFESTDGAAWNYAAVRKAAADAKADEL
ncbi:MAG: hypothetical protein JWN67_4063 [Actinomycetia bacterium]|nr:hypothetical protein [Actinomycetes bacterium]